MRVFTIYTDGSCLRNPGGPGSWAAVVLGKNLRRELSGKEPNPTTSNRMELTGAIEGLRFLGADPCKVTLKSDSKYVVNGASGWMRVWKKRGWMRREKKTRILVPPLNCDLWKEIDRLMDLHRITWQYVPGHAGVAENVRCDAMARNALRSFL